jgi:quercetin dioxygenase-like cupin family protein
MLYTNPTTQATYLVIRGAGHVPRHWHSSNESITVLNGTFTVAHDGSPDRTALAPGGFLYMPAKMIHEAWTGNEGAIYFITVDGKWDVNFVEQPDRGVGSTPHLLLSPLYFTGIIRCS